MTQPHRTLHVDGRRRVAATPLVLEYALVLAFVVLVGAIALAEVSGVLDSLVHSITFMV